MQLATKIFEHMSGIGWSSDMGKNRMIINQYLTEMDEQIDILSDIRDFGEITDDEMYELNKLLFLVDFIETSLNIQIRESDME